jgi:hypothetical protein
LPERRLRDVALDALALANLELWLQSAQPGKYIDE